MAAVDTPEAPAPAQNKRKSAAAGLPAASRPVKRRASKACCCCRARKVRCDVVESGAPCTNCRLDEVECVVTESKRRKKSRGDLEMANPSPRSSTEASEQLNNMKPHDDSNNNNHNNNHSNNSNNNLDHISPGAYGGLPSMSPSQCSVDHEQAQHVPHLLYRTQDQRTKPEGKQRRMSSNPAIPYSAPLSNMKSAIQQLFGPSYTMSNPPTGFLPDYIRGLPPRLQPEDIDYLGTKGALTVPDLELRNELLRCYIKYVHTYMPLLELEEFLQTIARSDGVNRLSLLLFQAVMFTGTAYIDMEYLHAAGYTTRKAARRAFFQRARLLYDFDYEVDRISLVQALLLMTYWYETPDDQKDTWHWMGVSLSLAHTIGLHRDPANSNMGPRRQKLWKRIWWSTYTRDRLIALGMRRPTRIKDGDCDVPMLTMDDFEFGPSPPEVIDMLGGCDTLQNVEHQKALATMSIEKAKLCLCISKVLTAQYSVLSHKFGGTTETTMMLVPKKSEAETREVTHCDYELESWLSGLPQETRYQTPTSSDMSEADKVLHLHRALLKMVYLATSSALHRPQVLPSTPYPTTESKLQDLSRQKVRNAAVEITSIADNLYNLDMTRYLPTTGVTVLLPAVIIHLLDIKSNDVNVRATSLRRFYQCMQILQGLREIYASADFATSFLEAAIRKAGIHLSTRPTPESSGAPNGPAPAPTGPESNGPASNGPASNGPASNGPTSNGPATNGPIPNTVRMSALTPPPDPFAEKIPNLTYNDPVLSPAAFAPTGQDPESLFVSTPPHSIGSDNGGNTHNDSLKANAPFSKQNPDTMNGISTNNNSEFNDFNDTDAMQNDFDTLINFDEASADLFAAENGIGPDLAARSEGPAFSDIDWMRDTNGIDNGNIMPDVKATEPLADGASSPQVDEKIRNLLDVELGTVPPGETGIPSNPRGLSITGDLDADIGLNLDG